jgi:hypothetical protein
MKPARPPSSSIRARPSSTLRRACALAIVAALPLGFARPARAQPQVSTAQADLARELFRKAAKEYTAGKVNEAYRDYLAAWNAQKSPDTAGNLGSIELELGYLREAAEHASYAIAHFPPTGSKAQRAALVSMLADACKQIGVLSIQVNVPGAAISIDGKPLGSAPLDGDVYIEPGDHTVLAEAPDHDPARQTIHVEKGSTTPVVLALTVHPTTGPQPAATPTNWPRPIAVAGVITAGAGFAAGTALAIMAKIKATDADAAGQALDALTKGSLSACPAVNATIEASCAKLLGAQQSRDTFANTALWMFVGATVVTVGTVAYTVVVPRFSAPTTTTGMSVVPVVTPSGGAVVIQGNF